MQVITRNHIFRNSNVPLDLMWIPYQPYHDWHRHEFTEMVVVLDGSGIHATEHTSYPIQSGDVFIIHESESHSYQNSQGLKIVNLFFDLRKLGLPLDDIEQAPEFCNFFSPRHSSKSKQSPLEHLNLMPTSLINIQNLLNDMDKEFKHNKVGFQTAAKSIFTRILVSIARELVPPEQDTNNGTTINNPQTFDQRGITRFSNAINYIQSNYNNPITVNELAKSCHASTSTLDRIFIQATGCSPIRYLIQFRIMKATELLLNTNLNIAEIAWQVGFEDSNYFTRQFKKIIGCSPRAYRKNKNSISNSPD